MRRSLIILGVITAFLLAPTALAKLGPNPANDPRLLSKPMDAPQYDPGRKCRSQTPPGIKALSEWMDRHIRGGFWGTYRCEKWGRGECSVHCESRAIDWQMNASNPKEKKSAYRFINMLLSRDKLGNEAALAHRMGVQGIIFNCDSWYGYGTDLGKYSYCYKNNGKKKDNLNPTQAHKDHIHIELNKKGAKKKTSFWKSPLANK